MGRNFQCFCDPHENFNRRRAFPALNAANVIIVDVCLLRESLLAQSRLLAELENGFANDFSLRLFEHLSSIKKQKSSKVTTHAPCRIDFLACIVWTRGRIKSFV